MKDATLVFTCAFGLRVRVNNTGAWPGGLYPEDDIPRTAAILSPELLRATAVEIERARALVAAAAAGS
jgi:hypothetical protein